LVATNTNAISSLKEVSRDFQAHLKSLAGTKNVTTTSSDTPGQFVFEFDRDKLGFIGLTPDDLLNEVYFYTNGVTAGSIKSDFEDNDIVLKVAEFEDYLSPSDIENLVIDTQV